MSEDLKIIKKKFGEKMMHLCRELFPTILEKEGELSKILTSNFDDNHFLYEDLDVYGKTNEFKNYIYNIFYELNGKKEVKVNNKTAKELLSDAGYILYECKTENDIQSFKKYYEEKEKLCTFNGNRLERCYVFFAVKKNVEYELI